LSRLVGRADELAALVSALGGLEPSRSSWAQVTGEPGIGKTRLLAELRRIAEQRGALVLVGRGAELEHDVPFGIVVDALDDYLGALGEERLAQRCGSCLAELRPLFPALSGAGPAAPRRTADERYRVYRAFRSLLQRLAEPAPLLLVLDDLHWADAASIELVSFLLRHPPEARVLAVLAWRPTHALGLQLGDTLAVSARDEPGTAVRLTSLRKEELAELLDESVGPGEIAALHRASGGNPFYAQALALATKRGNRSTTPGDVPLDEGAVPGAVAVAVRYELAALSRTAGIVARGAAVAGEPFEADLAARCSGLADAEAVVGLDELLARGVVREHESPRRFAFRHPIVRRAVYDSAGAAWRLTAHARAAAALAERGAPIVSIAHHVASSAVPGDLAAADLLVRAALEVVPHAPASATTWLDVAESVIPSRAEVADTRIALSTARARVACVLGDLSAARDAFEVALGLVPAGDARRAQLVAGCAGVEHGLGRFGDARERLLAALPGTQLADEAALCVELAVSSLYTLDVDAASAWADRAATAAKGVDRLLEGTARALVAFARATGEKGEHDEPYGAGRDRADAAADILDRLGDEEVATRLDALYYLGWAERLFEQYVAADRHLGRASAVADAGGGSQWLVPTLVEHAKVLAVLGQVPEASRRAATAVGAARVARVDLLLMLALTAQIAVSAAAGEIGAALSAGAEALTLCAEGADYHAANVHRQLALAHLDGGDPERFLAEIAACGDVDAELAQDGMDCRLTEARCVAELALGRPGAAADLAERTRQLAAGRRLPASYGFAERALARVSGRADPAGALERARRAVALFDGCGSHLEAARTRVLVAELLVSCGQLDAGLAECSAASAELAALGAELAASRARLAARRMRRAGARATRGPTVLSVREHEVADLVAEGHTNREIAARLSISENTVESHVGRILAKLGVPSRSAVARAIGRAAPLPVPRA